VPGARIKPGQHRLVAAIAFESVFTPAACVQTRTSRAGLRDPHRAEASVDRLVLVARGSVLV
jgi:hypothetical protein